MFLNKKIFNYFNHAIGPFLRTIIELIQIGTCAVPLLVDD